MHNSSFRIVADEEDKRLDLFLSERLSLTRTKVKNMIEGGHVRMEGKAPKPSSKLKKGLILEGEIPEEEPTSLIPQAIPLDILYEDDYLLAVNKPKGMVVHPALGHREGTLVNAILAYLGRESSTFNVQRSTFETNDNEEILSQSGEPCGSHLEHRTLNVERPDDKPCLRPGIVHRLDKGTTGVILIAKDWRTQELLSSLFKERAVHKTYRAIVEGVPSRGEGIIEGAIGRHPVERKKMAVVKEGGKEAVTSYKVLRRSKEFAYVEAYPRTGRTHQIRVHLAHMGHPIVGDDAYGQKARKLAERPLLHAYAITFVHPVKGVEISVTAPVPEDMEGFISSHEI